MSSIPRGHGVFPCAALLILLLDGPAALAQHGPPSSPSDSPPLPAYRADELLVRFRPNAQASDRAAVRARVGGRVLRDLGFIHAEHLKIRGVGVQDAVERLRRHPLVEYAEPNFEVKALLDPNDESFPVMYNLRNSGQTGGTPGADIRAPQAWDLFTGDPEIKIGVIDTGVDYTHPDLAANIWTNRGETPGNGRDDDGNGYVDDVHGYDFANNDGDPFDDNRHGTHVAGIIAAVGNNGVGVVGVNWRAKIVAIKFLRADGSGTYGGAIAAIGYAIAAGVRLTNNSWGGGGFSQGLLDAINAAGATGQLFTAAAGNASSNNDASPFYPASFDAPSIVAVASTDHNDQLSIFSSYGATTVDLAAPGSDILSTIPGGSYYRLSGTSMATPHVAGALAFVLGRFPSMAALQAKTRVMTTVDRLPSLAGVVVSGGRLNLFAAMREPDSIPPGAITDLGAAIPGSNTMGLAWTATGDDDNTGRAVRYEIRYSLVPITEANLASRPLAPGPTPQPAGAAESAEVTGLASSTTYYFAIKAFDEMGNAGPISNAATGTTLGNPNVTVTPASVSQTLLSGATATQSITVRNSGQGTLDFTVPDIELTFAQSVFEVLPLAKGESDPRPGILGSGGPDGFGYRWKDSDSQGGPPFSWVDITGVSQPVPLSGDDEISGPIPMGMSFPFYGGSFSTVYICTNGFITFTPGTGAPPSNQPLPGAGAPPNLIAPFWEDLNFPGTYAYAYNDGSRFIVSWVGVPPRVTGIGMGGPYTFQVILYPSGEIRFQYLSMRLPTTPSATVGIQNGNRTIGLTVVFNTLYVRNQLAVRAHREPPWLSVSPRSGRVYAGQETQLTLSFDALGLAGGIYDPHVLVSNNDPDEPGVSVPVRLHVIGAPDIAIERPPRLIESSAIFTNTNGTTLHDLPVPDPPAGGGVFELVAEGYTGYVDLSVEGRFLGRLWDRPDFGPACWKSSGEFAVDAATLATMAADGVVHAVVRNSWPPPYHFCALNRFVVRLRHPLPANSIDFGSRFEGLCARDSVRVLNQGTDTLRVTSIESSHPAFAASPCSFALPVGASRMVVVTYCPLAAGLHEGVITLHSDDPDEPATALSVRGRGLVPPNIAASPPHIVSNLSIPATETRTVTLRNTGGNDLAFSIQAASDGGAVAYEPSVPSPDLRDPAGAVGIGGPDAFGYRWVDSDHAGGPTFAWVDIARPENRVFMSGQDAMSEPVPLGMGFPFYGTPFTAIRVTTNGFLTFSSCCPVPSNVRLPSTVAPANLIAPFWDALSPGSVYRRFDGSRFIVSWIGALHRVTPGGPYAFQAILYPNGIIVYQYLSMTPTLTEATVGIQNAARNDGLTVVHNASYLHNALAVMLVPRLQYMTVQPRSGIVPPGGALDIGLEFHTLGLSPGVYRDTLTVSSNDPDEGTVSVPVVLNAGLLPDIAATPPEMGFGTAFIGQTLDRTVQIRNSGLGTLDVTGAAATGSGFSLGPADANLPALIGPGQSIPLVVRFGPSDVCTLCTGALVLHSNDPDENPLTVPLSGTGLRPPDFAASLDTLRAAGATTLGSLALRRTKPLLVGNSGGSDLQFTVPVSRESPSGPSSVRWISANPASGTIPAGASKVLDVVFDAAGLPDGGHVGNLVIVSNDPDESVVEVPCRFHVGVAGAGFDVDPNGLQPQSQGEWVSADLEPEAGLDPRAIVLSTVRLQRSVPLATDDPISYHDDDQDGLPQVRYKFDRASLLDLLAEGDQVPVEVIGEVRDVTWLRGVDLVRVLHGPAHADAHPAGSENRVPGEFGLRLKGPSPGRGSAGLELAIPTRSDVELSIFDTQGRLVSDVARREFDPGWHRLQWNGRDGSGAPAPAGVYFARLIAEGRAFRVRIALLR